MMKPVLIALIGLFTGMGVCGQIPDCERLLQTGPEIPGKQYYPDESHVDNLPYLYSKWVSGTLTLKNGQIIHDVHLLFDLSKNLLVYHNDNLNISEIIDHSFVHSFFMNDPESGKNRKFAWLDLHTFFFADTTGIFAEVLAEGKISAYVLRRSEKKVSSQVAYQNEQRYYYFPENATYIYSEGKYRRFIPGKRSVVGLTPQHKPEIKSFIRSNHLDMKKEDDFIKALNYINSL